jgi:UDP-N-acetylglucosamine acyltransferase
MSIHPTAVISERAKLGENVKIGPYTVIDDEVELGDNCIVGPHVHLSGRTAIGSNTRIHAGAVIGDEPQDYGFDSEQVTYTRVGNDCLIREYVTIHRATGEGQDTVVEDGVMLMAFAHVAHNCRVGERAVVMNNVLLAGHVQVGRRAIVSGSAMVHQFVRIGEFSLVSPGIMTRRDIPPYCISVLPDTVHGPNSIGMKRGGFDRETRNAVRSAIKQVCFGEGNAKEAAEQIATEFGHLDAVSTFCEFVRSSKRGVARGSAGR